ncbi:MAG TPA: hypothetical protein VGX68_21485 [Thermoanaerobaculia bacterium]|jgi:hypothetical protein|nr:hypothetical protein [Thermoanaerobaculia bacterium]
MAPLYEVFRVYGGIWITILLVITWIAFARLAETKDTAQRWVEALSQEWIMKTAIVIALASWAWNFWRLFQGDAYLRGSGSYQELSTIFLVLILFSAAVVWRSLSWRLFSRFRAWSTHGLVLILIISSGPLLLASPKEDLSQGEQNDPGAVAFIQGRLKQLGCYSAAHVPEPTEVSFDALTASAVISLQSANRLLQEPADESDVVRQGMGVIRHNIEFPLLARPFPFVFGPKHCRRVESSR